MNSPAFGLGWLLYQRHRLGLTLFAIYMVFLAIASHLPPSLYSEAAMRVLTTPFGFGLLYLMGIFANADSDLASTRSGYASPLFILPVRTRSLIIWPMLYGGVSVALVWVAFAVLILVPQGQSAYVWWPATLLAALTACLQALSWYPVPLPYLRGILAFALLAALTGLGALGSVSRLAAVTLSAIFLLIIPLAGLIAARGVALARQGENREQTWLPERRQESVVRRRFASPAQAQLWLEWKRNGLLLPLLTLLICLLFALPLATIGKSAGTPLGIGGIEVHFAARLWLVCLLWAPLTAMVIGCCPVKSETFRPDLTLQPFLATRPLSSLDIVLAKLRMAALSTGSAWAIQCVFLAGWAFLPAQDGALTGTIGGLLWRYMTIKSSLALPLLLIGLVGWTWKCQVSGLWIELTGRRWLINGYAIAFPMFMATLIGWSLNKAATEPTFVTRALPFLPLLAFGVALLKFIVILGAVCALRGHNLVASSRLKSFLGDWLIAAAALVTLLLYLLPPDLVSPLFVALGVFLYLPLSPLLLAPLALHWNRHR